MPLLPDLISLAQFSFGGAVSPQHVRLAGILCCLVWLLVGPMSCASPSDRLDWRMCRPTGQVTATIGEVLAGHLTPSEFMLGTRCKY